MLAETWRCPTQRLQAFAAEHVQQAVFGGFPAIALRQVHQLAGHAVQIAFAEFLAEFVGGVVDLDRTAAHDIEETVARRKRTATAQVTNLDVAGQLVEQAFVQVDEGIALREKLADLEEFDFHPAAPVVMISTRELSKCAALAGWCVSGIAPAVGVEYNTTLGLARGVRRWRRGSRQGIPVKNELGARCANA